MIYFFKILKAKVGRKDKFVNIKGANCQKLIQNLHRKLFFERHPHKNKGSYLKTTFFQLNKYSP